MISKAKIKFIKSLQIKKYRTQEQCFLVEGAKSISELLKSDFTVQEVLGTKAYLDSNEELFNTLGIPTTAVKIQDLQVMGGFKTNDAGVAIVQMKINELPTLKNTEFGLILDDIRDPGNLGTIIRTADWYGITNIIVSPDTTDFYNPKVLAASMGSFTRVHVCYTNLVDYIRAYTGIVYGAFLDGENVHEISFGQGGLLVMGNESNGISETLGEYVTRPVTIPRVGEAESLNVATATAIILDNISRRI